MADKPPEPYPLGICPLCGAPVVIRFRFPWCIARTNVQCSNGHIFSRLVALHPERPRFVAPTPHSYT